MVAFFPKKPPIGIDALIKDAMDTEEQISEDLQLSVFLDDSASGELIALVRSAFADAAANVRVTISYVGSAHAIPDPEDDMSVIVAGQNLGSAELFRANQEAGVPCMIITMDAAQLLTYFRENGQSIDAQDIISADKKDSEPLTKQEVQKVLDGMGKWICSTCQDKSLSFARSFAFARRPLSIDCVNLTSLENCLVGLLILKPGTNLPIMTMNQMKMLLQIAAAYNQPINGERAPELAAVLAAAYCGRGLAYKVCGDIPVLSMVVRGAIGYATTLCVGRTAVLYFENGGGVSGLAKTLNNARELLFAKIPRMQIAQPDNNDAQGNVQASGVGKITSLGKQAVNIGIALGNAAVPLAKSAAQFGADSFKSSVKGLVE